MKRFKHILVFALLNCLAASTVAQCELFDFYGNPTQTPYWYSCTGTDYTLNLQSPNNIGNWTVNWGDGSPIESGASLTPPGFIGHTYIADVDTFIVVFTDVTSGCVTEGVLVMEEATSASIQIPVGGLTQACAPQNMEFINSSTNVSENTIFTWDFGDGSPDETYDYTNLGQTISHTYQQNTVDCETVVTLTAQNYCNTIQGGSSFATFNPIRIWDYDDADITPSAGILCWPDNTVDYMNTSEMNCFMQGNIAQRYEYWNFGDYWGLGYDSIVDWTPWPPTFPHTMTYPAIGTYDVMLLDSNFCGIDTAYISIQIVPPPTAGLTASDDTVCVGEMLTFFNGSSAEANAFQINYDDGNGWQGVGGGHVNHAFDSPGDYQVGLIALIAGAGASCTDTAWVDVHVLSSPVADFDLSETEACGSLTTVITDASINAAEWDWNMGNGNAYASQNVPDQTYGFPAGYHISLTVTSINGCTDNTTDLVTVFTNPIASFSAMKACVGDSVNFVDNSFAHPNDPVVSWDWDFGDLSSSSNPNPEHIYTVSGNYDVSLTVSTANCSDDTIVNLLIDAPPSANFSMDVSSGCSPLEVQFSNTSVGASSYTWFYENGVSSADVNTSYTFENNSLVDTTYIVTLVAHNSAGCTDTSFASVTVNPQTTASFTSNAIPGCAPFVANFTNTSSNASGYIWDFGDGSATVTDTHPAHLYLNSTPFIQTYMVTLIALSPSGCHDTLTQTVVSYPEPNFQFDLSGYAGCNPLHVDFPDIPGAVTYQWDFGDGVTANGPTPEHTYVNSSNVSQTYTVELIASSAFGCVDTTYSDIEIYPSAVVQVSSDVNEGCSPLEVEFTNSSLLADQSYWVFTAGDTLVSNDATVTHTFTNNGTDPETFLVELAVTTLDGCLSTSSIPITVYPEPMAQFESVSSGCSPLTVNFDNESTGAISYLWHFGDGQIAADVDASHVYYAQDTDTTYQAHLLVTNSYGCQDKYIQLIDVLYSPVAGFLTTDFQGCTPLEVELTNTSILATDFDWDYGDGNSSNTSDTSHVHTLINTSADPVTYSVELTATAANGCADQSVVDLTVYPAVIASFIGLEEGCHPLDVSFENNSQGALTYSWDFGNGFTDVLTEPDHTFFNYGIEDEIFDVTLTAISQYGCQGVDSLEVTVYPLPDAEFVASPVIQVFPDATVDIIDLSVGGYGVYTWDMGDGFTSDDSGIDSHTYNTWGTYDLSLTISTDHCSDQSVQVIEILPPGAVASFEGHSEGCAPVTISFENNSQYADSYLWNFGDGGTSSNESPTYTFYIPGTYTVSLLATGQGGSDLVVSDTVIQVHPNASAYFTVNPPVVNTFDPVLMYNLSINADEYQWEFGDGGTSTEENPVYEFEETGTYGVTLVANNEFNCPDTFHLSEAVLVDLGGYIEFPNAFTPNLTGESEGAYDPTMLNNDVFFPVYSGVEEYELQIYNRWGELLFESNDINIGWNGAYRGSPAQQGVYVWRARVTFTDGKQKIFAGDVTLLR